MIHHGAGVCVVFFFNSYTTAVGQRVQCFYELKNTSYMFFPIASKGITDDINSPSLDGVEDIF